MPAVPSRVVWVMSMWDLGDVSGMQTQAPPSSILRTLSHPVCFPWNWCKSSWGQLSPGREPGRISSSPAHPGLTQSRTGDLTGHGSAQAVNAPLHFYFSSAKISFSSAFCYWGFCSCSHPPQLSTQQTPAFHLQSDFVIHGWFQISLSAW